MEFLALAKKVGSDSGPWRQAALEYVCHIPTQGLTCDQSQRLFERYWPNIFRALSKQEWSQVPKLVPQNAMKAQYHNDVSFSGVSTSILISGIQKYIRRNMFDKGVWCANQLYLFTYVPEEQVQRATAIITNLRHRLMIIYLEDVGPANLGLWTRLNELIPKVSYCSVQNFVKRHEAITALFEAVKLMTSTSHSRVVGHYHTAIVKAQLFKESQDLKERELPQLLSQGPYPLLKKLNYQLDFERELTFFADPKLNQWCSQLYACLEKRDLVALWWASNIASSKEPLLKKFRRSSKAVYAIFAILEQSFAADKVYLALLDLAFEWRKELQNLKEAFLTYEILIVAWCHKVEPVTTKVEPVSSGTGSTFSLALTQLVEIDDYVIDMHTREGRRKNLAQGIPEGKNYIAFAEEGSKVAREVFFGDLSKEAKKFYGETKYQLQWGLDRYLVERRPSEILENEYIQLRVRAQLTCAMYRGCTYFATLKETGARVFVKGPYLDEASALAPIKICSLKKDLFTGLYVTQVKLVSLVPNMFTKEQCPVGTRTLVEPGKAYPFLIYEDLCDLETMPTKMHSAKVWPATQVVDWGAEVLVNKCGPLDPDQLDEEGWRQYVLNLLFRYALGIPDAAKRNFLYFPRGRPLHPQVRVIAVDEEGWSRKTDMVDSLRKNLAAKVAKKLKQEYATLQPFLNAWFQGVQVEATKERLVQDLSLEGYNFLVTRLQEMQTLEGAVTIFQH
jgi:hypothetical protein